MAASTRSKASKTRSGLTREPVPLTKSRKRQLSNPEEAKQPTKKGKNEHGDSDSDSDNRKDDNDDNDEDNKDDNDNDNDDEGKREGAKVVDDGKGTKRAKRAAKAAKCVPAPSFNTDKIMFLTGERPSIG
jgi:hypothetical protein